MKECFSFSSNPALPSALQCRLSTKARKEKKNVKMYPLSLQTVLMLLGTCGSGLGQPVLHTGTLREAGV